LTSSPLIREAAAVAVPDDLYGEVVGAWIVLEDNHDKLLGRKTSREDVREIVQSQMNPQVRNLHLSKVTHRSGRQSERTSVCLVLG